MASLSRRWWKAGDWAMTALRFCLALSGTHSWKPWGRGGHMKGSQRGRLQVTPAPPPGGPQLAGAEMRRSLCACPNSGPMESVSIIRGPGKPPRFGVSLYELGSSVSGPHSNWNKHGDTGQCPASLSGPPGPSSLPGRPFLAFVSWAPAAVQRGRGRALGWAEAAGDRGGPARRTNPLAQAQSLGALSWDDRVTRTRPGFGVPITGPWGQ